MADASGDLTITSDALRGIFPRAPQAVLDNLIEHSDALAKVGILKTRRRLAYCFANVEHETSGFSIPNLTESIAYSRARAKAVWPSRKAQIDRLPGEGATFQRALMNAMYGGRMGNRPGTDDGVRYIGRGGPQITGREGYEQIAKRTGLPLVDQPELAGRPENQAQIIAAFWDWKGMNRFADAGDFRGCVKAWNGGNIGQADREAMLAGNDAYIGRLKEADRIIALAPPEPPPPIVEAPKPPPPAAPPPMAPVAPQDAPPAASAPSLPPGTETGVFGLLAAFGALLMGYGPAAALGLVGLGIVGFIAVAWFTRHRG